jgi:ATP-dependent Clp protease ATP-binding subunit ClpC
MNIADRFSTHLREIMAKSIRIATEMHNPLVEPIHLLFVMQTQNGSVAAEILVQFKLDYKIVEQAILSLPSDAKPTDPIKKNIDQLLLANFSETTKSILEKAMFIAHENDHNYVGTEHLLVATILLKDPLVEETLKNSKINIENLSDQLKAVLNNASQFPQITDAAEMMERIQQSLGDDLLSPQTPMTQPIANNKKQKKKETALDFFATDLTNPATQKNIDPVIGREKEIERLAQILCRRTKNNPILLGDPGVGKTAIVEGLAKKIMNGEVPDVLLGKKVYALDMGMLIAGTTFRGEFEARLHHVIEDIAEDPNIILFIDEIHNIVGAGSNQGTMDAANILKPVLARGHLRCIGATTPNEFKKYIESDAALERRFQPIYVKQSSIEDTLKILAGIKKNFEIYHNLKISADAIKMAVKLSDRFISNKFLPDKAIDLLDETAAAKKLKTKASSEKTELWKLQRASGQKRQFYGSGKIKK